MKIEPKVCKGTQVVLEGPLKSQLYILQYNAESLKINQQRFSILMDIQFGTIPLEFGLGSVLKNLVHLSLEVMGNITLPPPSTAPSYSEEILAST